MNHIPFTRKFRQFRFLVKQLNQQIKSGIFQQFSSTKKRQLINKLNRLMQQLQQAVPTHRIRRSIAKATFLLALGTATSVQAQSFAAPEKNPYNLQSSAEFFASTFVDIDNDGDLDLYVSGYPANVNELGLYFVENIGSAATPQFTANHVPDAFDFQAFENIVTADFADIDNDGDFDMFVGIGEDETYTGSSIEYLENIGTAEAPLFASNINNPFGLVNTSGISLPKLMDIDADGDMDLFVSEYYGKVRFFENIGSPESPLFTAPIENPFGISTQDNVNGELTLLDFADLDNDGDMDLVVNNINMPCFIYENTLDSEAGNYLKYNLKRRRLIILGLAHKSRLLRATNNFTTKMYPPEDLNRVWILGQILGLVQPRWLM